MEFYTSRHFVLKYVLNASSRVLYKFKMIANYVVINSTLILYSWHVSFVLCVTCTMPTHISLNWFATFFFPTQNMPCSFCCKQSVKINRPINSNTTNPTNLQHRVTVERDELNNEEKRRKSESCIQTSFGTLHRYSLAYGYFKDDASSRDNNAKLV